jgi:3-hydroxybutyryl-CoA dehydrogenase
MFKHLGVVGAGTMGRGIAQLAALSKINVQFYDVNETILRRSLELIKADLRKMINLGKLPSEEFPAIIERIRTRTSLSDLGHCDCVIESVIEDIRVKKDLFKHLDTITGSTAILASTTSSLPITSIASLTRNPERVIGLHFLNPVNTTVIVEVIKGFKTNAETLDRAIKWVKLLGKDAVIAKDIPGFIVNRISLPFFSEALRLLGENVAYSEQIDNIVRKIGGFPSGPFEILDQTGIDTALAETELLYNQSYGEPRLRPHPVLKQMVESGLLGKKSAKGFYNYEDIK